MAILSYQEAKRIAQLEFAVATQFDLLSFLNMAWRFPGMSLENICLLLLQYPEATELQTETGWRECLHHLQPHAQAITLMVQEQSVMLLYDVTQTDCNRSAKEPDSQKAYEALLKALGADPIELEDTNHRIAYYDPGERAWFVNVKAGSADRFQSVVRTITAKLLDRKKGIDSMLANDMATYMICQKYGVSATQVQPANMQGSLARQPDEQIRSATMHAALECMDAPFFNDLQARYNGKMMEQTLLQKKRAEEAEKAEAARQAEIRQTAMLLARQMAQEQKCRRRKGLLQFWKTGGASK